MGTINSAKLDYSKIITDRLNDVTGDHQVLVEDLLTRIGGTEVRISKALTRSGVRRIDDIEFFGGEGSRTEFDVLRGEKRRLIEELERLLNLRGYTRSSGMGGVCVG